MSAQGGTLARRGAVHLPIWPVAALLGAAVVAVVGMSILSGTEKLVTSVTDAQRLENSSAAVREQGATLPFQMSENPGMWTLSQAESHLARLAAIENSTAAIREQGATIPLDPPFVNPGMWTTTQAEAYVDSLTPHAVGLENPGAYVREGGTYATGLENPGAYAGETSAFTPKTGAHQLIEVNGQICGQCR